MKRWLANATLLGFGCLFALAAAEIASRLVYPLATGVSHVTADGENVKAWLAPGRVYRQVSAEYDAVTTITERGHRAPAVEGDPEVIFLGDSFTFGWGLADDETFASIACRSLEISCANLGAPGTGTGQQVERLERFLQTWDWRPREVKLFLFAMTDNFSAGNDLADNVDRERRRARASEARVPERAGARPGVLERALGLRRTLLAHSNLLRIVKFYWGPALRSVLRPGLDRQRLEEALAITGRELRRLDALGDRYGFETALYLIHPVQDILRATHHETLAQLSRVAPVPLRSTAPLFEENPTGFYYPYDGHLDPDGSRRIAELLISEARAEPARTAAR